MATPNSCAGNAFFGVSWFTETPKFLFRTDSRDRGYQYLRQSISGNFEFDFIIKSIINHSMIE